MFGDNKTLKDSYLSPTPLLAKDRGEGLPAGKAGVRWMSYNKTDKLITALYMVTDIMDTEEPLRNKLRTLGTDIISDIQSAPVKVIGKVAEIVSFLGIATAINIISEMNANILRKEFLKLEQAVREYCAKENELTHRDIDLGNFLRQESLHPYPASPLLRGRSKEGVVGRENSKGHARLGVQKGSTLLKALSDKNIMSVMSDKSVRDTNLGSNIYKILKGQRSNEIEQIIKANNGSATIKDILDKTYGSLINCSEKTLQRELVSMVKNGVLEKTGEKRWSRYILK